MNNLVPKNKFDISTAEKLNNYSIDQIRPIVPQLLEWLQDGNWPVALPISDYLKKNVKFIQVEILDIFKGDDQTWKYWIILVLGDSLDNELLITEIKRIGCNPTKSEIYEGLYEVVNDLIAEKGW